MSGTCDIQDFPVIFLGSFSSRMQFYVIFSSFQLLFEQNQDKTYNIALDLDFCLCHFWFHLEVFSGWCHNFSFAAVTWWFDFGDYRNWVNWMRLCCSEKILPMITHICHQPSQSSSCWDCWYPKYCSTSAQDEHPDKVPVGITSSQSSCSRNWLSSHTPPSAQFWCTRIGHTVICSFGNCCWHPSPEKWIGCCYTGFDWCSTSVTCCCSPRYAGSYYCLSLLELLISFLWIWCSFYQKLPSIYHALASTSWTSFGYCHPRILGLFHLWNSRITKSARTCMAWQILSGWDSLASKQPFTMWILQ